MSMVALCAGHDLTIQLRGCKAWLTLLRCTILVKVKDGGVIRGGAFCVKTEQNGPFFARMRQFCSSALLA
ncbi:hypothetical protein [Massilia sp. TWR1-2-2]|uniref:hypothetical protein n=1 Tax=Massilia sp. TWR1-2-2 TaxID=2804584 RepID=UPI003CEFDE27